jgi:hypothetical protein
MKQRNFIFISLVTFLLLFSSINYRSNAAPGDVAETFVMVRVYEGAWVKTVRGIYIIYPDGKKERTEIGDELDPLSSAQKVIEALNKVGAQGYMLVSCTKLNGSGVNSSNSFTEYIFKK